MRFFRRPQPTTPLQGLEPEPSSDKTAPLAGREPEQAPHASAGGFAAGEDREVTVLFADLEGFTTLAEQLPAAEVVGLLNAYFTVMTAEVDRFGGTVDKFIGDAMLVVWTGPSPQAAAEQAVRAALAIQAAVAGLQERLL
ncbi:MAG TPA: adenylate/guanylate cyclase domain-containing protein, partial [Stenomitos sp.]